MTILNHGERSTANPSSAANEESHPSNNRRSKRVVIDFPVTIFGQTSDGRIFAEQTKTVTVSAHGGLVILETDIDRQKPVLLENIKSRTEVHCRIVYRKEIGEKRFEIGLEFENPLPRFWGMTFPPIIGTPRSARKLLHLRG